MQWSRSWKENFEEGLQAYRTPLFLLTTSTFFILLARVFTLSTVALGTTLTVFVVGCVNLLAAGVSAAYSIVRNE